MAADKSVRIGNDAAGAVVTTGDNNRITASVSASLETTTLPPATSVDLAHELQQLRELLVEASPQQAGKIARALEDAAEESNKPSPDKDEVGKAISRALEYAERGEKFVDVVNKIAPHIKNAAAWLGANWYRLLPVVGLAI
jgi:acetylornithine deacetylase/succinyl-diaminopimelate desuccinylase-like protein